MMAANRNHLEKLNALREAGNRQERERSEQQTRVNRQQKGLEMTQTRKEAQLKYVQTNLETAEKLRDKNCEKIAIKW
jgi:hypothetical protein